MEEDKKPKLVIIQGEGDRDNYLRNTTYYRQASELLTRIGTDSFGSYNQSGQLGFLDIQGRIGKLEAFTLGGAEHQSRELSREEKTELDAYKLALEEFNKR
ncbi:hypothetical protein J4216_02575 [Candidatus Woesearchaeota archaeon]|nr:hypothetical protein [Candidatus Woesearchaeota archaeon]